MQAAFPRASVPSGRIRARRLPRAGLAGLILLCSAPCSPLLAQDLTATAAHPAHHATHRPAHATAPQAGHANGHHAAAPHATAHPVAHAHPLPPRHHAPAAAAPPARPAVPPPAAAAVVAPASPAAPAAAPKGSSTGLPLPRFASLRADAVNLRGGPGTRYPIQWVYKRRDLPVRIEREFDVWRLVEDSEGVKGWVHQATLVGTRTFVVPGETGAGAGTVAEAGLATRATADASPAADATPGQARVLGSSSAPTVAGRLDPTGGVLPAGAVALRAAPQPDGGLVAVLMPGIVGRLRSCSPGSGWCKVSVRDYAGWLPRDAVWGLLPDETILPP